MGAILNRSDKKTMNDTAFVTPKSKKAKNRFANLMGRNPECKVDQIKGNSVHLRSVHCSTHGPNFFWVDMNNDPHWNVEF